MAHIHVLTYEESTGMVREEYDKALKRAGRIWNIVSVQSQLPEVMRDSLRLYGSIMFGPSPLSRSQRELLAATTSQINECFYWTSAHFHDLRAEVADNELVDRIVIDWETSGLDGPTLALVRFAEKLTRTPAAVTEEDVQMLRANGFDDPAISSCVQVVSYFNYINRIAEGLGIDHEDWIDEAGRIKDGPEDR